MKEVSFDKKYFIETYGCQMNESDTERISGQLEELGYVPADILDDADVVILNTCSIRQNAEEKVYGKIGEVKKLKGKKPGVLLGIAGCMAQENKGKLIERMPVIDFVIGPYHIHDLKDIVSRRGAEGSHVVMTQMNPNRVNDYSELHSVRKSRIFAWVPIMLADHGPGGNRAVGVEQLDPVVIDDAGTCGVVLGEPDHRPAAVEREHDQVVGVGRVDAPLLVRRDEIQQNFRIPVGADLVHSCRCLQVDWRTVAGESLTKGQHPRVILVKLLSTR